MYLKASDARLICIFVFVSASIYLGVLLYRVPCSFQPDVISTGRLEIPLQVKKLGPGSGRPDTICFEKEYHGVPLQLIQYRPFESRIDINKAPREVLAMLPGIGDSSAELMVIRRQLYGPFRTIQDVDDIQGIGSETARMLQSLITFESE